uniref:WCX domain-containing protein n=1 Tax=uncultured Bacillota bacterium TaxID=344338 RepID=A0A650EN89_9FIRM|nr:hypothetical protein Firmicute1046_2090 [uncultured Firmicutes bacterium]
MIFNEIYSAYYNTVAKILAEILKGNKSEENLNKIISENAFGESILSILPSLKSEKWQIVKSDLTTPIKHKPAMPMTTVQKQWLKAILQDPRIGLFDLKINGLEDTEPLFTPDDYVIYDKYADGDPYDDEAYILHFRTILNAIGTKQALKIEMTNRHGDTIQMNVLPIRLEYSEKDDKFRLISLGCRYGRTINLARIVSCKIYNGENFTEGGRQRSKQDNVTLKICDERNALERIMLHFAHFEKQAERIDDNTYIVRITYNKDDETEMLIRILGFGPVAEVVAPDSFRALIIERLKQQMSCEL